MVVIPAVAAAVAAPLLALCSARLERRAVLVALSALVLVSDVIGGLAPGSSRDSWRLWSLRVSPAVATGRRGGFERDPPGMTMAS